MFKRASSLIVWTAALMVGALVACAPSAPASPTAATKAGTTGAAATAVGTASPAAAVGTGTPSAARTGTPSAAGTGTPSAAGTGTPMAGTTGAMATGTPMAGTTGTTGTPSAAMTGMPQIRIIQSLDLQNPTPLSIDLSGWKLRIGGQTVTLPSNARIGPNETATIHFVNPPATPSAGGTAATAQGKDVYLGDQGQQLVSALRPGARLMLENPQGQVVTEFALPA